MICSRKSKDPIAKFFQREDLIFLSLARSRGEVQPGTLIRTFSNVDRPPELASWDLLFETALGFDIEPKPFRVPDEYATSNNLSVGGTGAVSSVLENFGIPSSELQAALSKSNGQSFNLRVSGCFRLDLPVTEFESKASTYVLKPFGNQCFANGEKISIVTRSIESSTFELTTSDKSEISADISAEVEGCLSGKFKVSAEHASAGRLRFYTDNEAPVIAFQSMPLVKDDATVTIAGLNSVKKVRGVGTNVPKLSADKLNDLCPSGNDLFLELR